MLKKHFRQWIYKRFQFEDTKQIKQKDVLIFIYQQGYLYLVLILITFIAGVNYANNLILGFCFLISAILCVSFYLTFKQLHGLEVELIYPEIGRVEDALTIQVQLKQSIAISKYLYLKVDDQLHPILFNDVTHTLNLSFIPLERGKFSLPEIQLFSTYPIGLVRAWTYFLSKKIIWIAPSAKLSQSESQYAQSTGQPDHDEFRELRNYQLGDSLQSVSWKQAARGQGLYVKQFEDHHDLNVIQIDYEKMPSSNHEEKLSLMMGLVDECESLQAQYSLQIQGVELAQGVGSQQYLDAKRILAQVN